jgi:protein O-mannosyl-transferase
VPAPQKLKLRTRGTHPALRPTLILLILTILALSPVLSGGFIRLDDYDHLFDNPQLRRMSLSGLAGVWARPYWNLYIPITYSVWWALELIGSLAGNLAQSAWLFHAFNLGIHLANVVLVFFLVRALVRGDEKDTPPKAGDAVDGIALIAALLFGLHPMQVESVAWVSELKGELAAMFGLLGLWVHCRSGRRVVVALLFIAATLSKPSAIVFPAIVLLVDRVLLRKKLGASVLLAALYSVPLLFFAIVTKHLQPNSELDFVPLLHQRLVVAADAIVFYVTKVLAPFHLAVDYGRTPRLVIEQTSSAWLACSSLIAVAGIGLVINGLVRPKALAQVPGRSLIYCGWGIFLASLAPVLGLVPFGFQSLSTVANRYLYVPFFGLSLILAGVLVRFRSTASSRRIAALYLTALAALSFQQAWRWRSTEALFSYTMSVNPRSYIGAFCIGDELMRSGRLDESVGWLQKSLALNPDNLNAVLTLGMAFVKESERARAIELYRSALMSNPSAAGARAKNVAALHNNLGLLLLQSGNRSAAVEHFREAVEIFPRSLNAHLNLGNVAFDDRRYGDAVDEYNTALSITPGSRSIEQRLELARRGAQQ